MKKQLTVASATSLMAISSFTQAADLSIDIQNLTQGMYFTPILAVAHTPDASLFEVGETAIPELQEMAEGGSLAGLATVGDAISADYVNTEGLTGPGTTQSVMLTNAEGNSVLSIVAMILPTNDGFIGLDNWAIPSEPGTYTLYINGYDAGTEANDELRGSGAPGEAGMPVPPPLDPVLGTGGSGVTTEETNATVHIHRGNLGDESAVDGTSDIDNTVHRWLNPIAKVTVTIN